MKELKDFGAECTVKLDELQKDRDAFSEKISQQIF
jgi:hypothetical protein